MVAAFKVACHTSEDGHRYAHTKNMREEIEKEKNKLFCYMTYQGYQFVLVLFSTPWRAAVIKRAREGNV